MNHLWDLLRTGSCAVSSIPSDRWHLDRFYHPGRERGRTYTWAAGILEDVWGFDPSVFGLSPREAEQMDPQQRLLMELTWEALEDAGIRPSDIAGSQTGVYIGGSALDYGNLRLHDIAAADAYFATGNTLSILSNRVSYAFDLHGPSFTIDTACSSSLVALNKAVEDIQSGRVETAVVGGISLLLSPFGFISFSQATMLSRSGLCQAFSANADGYVRSEGGIVLVLRARKAAEARGERIHSMIASSGVNSDGRTSGIALPSKIHQRALLERIYWDGAIDPNRVAFVEAHGTGTKVGDPAEAGALGEILGQRRHDLLPIGSIKTNIGHLEPASGLAGVMKAMLALEHDELPASLHADELNPDIPFDDLNLLVNRTACPLPRGVAPRFAGISNFGFGGTNAHVVLSDPPATAAAPSSPSQPEMLMISAQSRTALGELAARYAEQLGTLSESEAKTLMASAGYHREVLAQRFAVPYTDKEALVSALQTVSSEPDEAGATAVESMAPVAFVYSGNGAQWSGMGLNAYSSDEIFRKYFDAVDALFAPLAGWSLATMLETIVADPDHLTKASISQPLMFAIQVATTRRLSDYGLKPDMVLGHSVGEIAAAHVAGALDLDSAVRVVHARSIHQELTRDAGSMSVFFGTQDVAEKIISKIPGLEIAAINSPRGLTLSGPLDALKKLEKAARRKKVRVRRLDLAYPFHATLMSPVEAPLRTDLANLKPGPSSIPFISTVEGMTVDGTELDALYWWRNVREPVLFRAAIENAATQGARVFVEIGASTSLLAHIDNSLEMVGVSAETLGVHESRPDEVDPFRRAVTKALERGAKVDPDKAFGADPGPLNNLPHYPWQRNEFRLGETTETTGLLSAGPWHSLIGARLSRENLEWTSDLDAALVPALADHKIGTQVLLPGAAFAEMALAVARDWLNSETAAVTELHILQPMVFQAGKSREVLCRVAPMTSTLDIMSRPRLSSAAYVTHARAKIVHKPVAPQPPVLPTIGTDALCVDSADLYNAAHQFGLNFGPCFRQVERAYRLSPTSVVVELTKSSQSTPYGLDPARLDSCFHGLILLFSDELETQNTTAYIPVRFGEVRLIHPGAVIAHATIQVRQKNERRIIADFALFDSVGDPIAVLREVRFQGISTTEHKSLSHRAFVQRALKAEGLSANQGNQPVDLTGLVAASNTSSDISAVTLLTEGWATTTAYRLISGLAEHGQIHIETLITSGRLPENLKNWLTNLLNNLASSRLVVCAGDVWSLTAAVHLPDSNALLRKLAKEHPECSMHLLLGARVGAMVDAIVKGALSSLSAPLAWSAIEAFDLGSPGANDAATALDSILLQNENLWPKDRALNVLLLGHGPMSSRAAELVKSHGARLTIFEFDRRRYERSRLTFEHEASVTVCDALAALPAPKFDLVLSAGALHRIIPNALTFADLAPALAGDATLLFVEPGLSLFRDLVFGLDENWFTASSNGALRTSEDWSIELQRAGLQNIHTHTLASSAGAIVAITAQHRVAEVEKNEPINAIIIADSASPLADALTNQLMDRGGEALCISSHELATREAAHATWPIVFMEGLRNDSLSVNHILNRTLALKTTLEHVNTSKTRVWVVTEGATQSCAGSNAAETGFWSFARTASNEFAALDIRRLDLAPGMDTSVAASRLVTVLQANTAETDIVLSRDSADALRLRQLDNTPAPANWSLAEAYRLEKREGTGLDRIRWMAVDRKAPKSDDVEIAVEATGLNFRDVMWGLSILPDEMLEDGFAGPTLGLECSGRVVRIGKSVTHVAPGDRVVAFAGGAFASHVTVKAALVAPIPDALSAEAAATIPVAFLTAYYALMSCAQLKAGEWILIHGGAGGVGLAALQIAQWRGAHVIATAGSAEKRDLLRTLGADHVFDSRSGAFVDGVRQVAPKGVAVVLNSLSGEPMEQSISLLEPFGRFVELGKRDYLQDNHIGLRPFRRNLSYFGVDLDQLIVARPEKGTKLFYEVMDLVAKGVFTPLPYRVFPGRDFIEAMRLMQQSDHIGKIVITPPEATGFRKHPEAAFPFASDKTHIITGGFGGFGVEAARWLADRGARHLVILARNGPSSDEAKLMLEDLRQRGVDVQSRALDITDTKAVEALFAEIATSMPPIAGIIHAAMVLDDAAITNLNSERLEAVLRPKVIGAEHLNRLTRTMSLDYFILFSSATTFIGNPGQGSYVAANGFLEAIARQRRLAGLPALAIAWGAIEDVGVLARNTAVKDMLADRAGVSGITARDALDLMGEYLARRDEDPDAAVVAIADINWSTAQKHIPLLRSPSYAELIHSEQTSEGEHRKKIDLQALTAMMSPDELRKMVADLIAEEIAHILRMPQQDINRTKPLSEIGLDSLMGVELAMGLEERLGLDAPLSAAAGSYTLLDLTEHVISSSTAISDDDTNATMTLASRHLGKDVDQAMIATLAIMVDNAKPN